MMRGVRRLASIRDRVLGAVERLPPERVAVAAAAGRWLAEPVVAVQPVPPFDCSAMDGYAVRSVDAARRCALRVGRALFAGDDPGPAVGEREAVRIYTGAPLPPGADAVVRQEAAREVSGTIELRDPVEAGDNVRRGGEDVAPGSIALAEGCHVGPRQLALLASVGVGQVLVRRSAAVALLSTGDEIERGRTPNSNGPAVSGLLRDVGADVRAEVVGDDEARIVAALQAALGSCDAVVTTGGVSVGARDLVRGAIEAAQGDVRVHGVPMRPGKPFLFAIARGRPIFGLPGSPSACLVAFEVFVRPSVLRMMGASRVERRVLRLPAAEAIAGRPGRDRFLWARLEGDGRVRPLGRDVAQVRGPALADALVHLGDAERGVREGEPVETWLLEGDAP